MKRAAPETASIAAGIVSALGASTCCVLPLLAVSVGLGGAWIAQMRELERFFAVFVGIAIAAFAYARPPKAAARLLDDPGIGQGADPVSFHLCAFRRLGSRSC